MWATHTLFKLPGFSTCSFTTSVEVSSYTTSWKPYYKNPGYAPGSVVIDKCQDMAYSESICKILICATFAIFH